MRPIAEMTGRMGRKRCFLPEQQTIRRIKPGHDWWTLSGPFPKKLYGTIQAEAEESQAH